LTETAGVERKIGSKEGFDIGAVRTLIKAGTAFGETSG
jgi:hypothetical protein